MTRAWLRFKTTRPRDWNYNVVIGVDLSEYAGLTADIAARQIVRRACEAFRLKHPRDLILRQVKPG